MRFVLRHDRRRSLYFAALSGEFGRRVLLQHPELAEIDSLIWLEPPMHGTNGRVLVRSEAALAVTRYLGGVWQLAQFARLLPRSLRDAAYSAFARRRHALLGRDRACAPPPESERYRFLDLSPR